MKKALLIFLSVTSFVVVSAESLLEPINDLGYGSWKARLESLSMYSANNWDGGDIQLNTLATKIDYLSPEIANVSGGGSFIYVEPFLGGGSWYRRDRDYRLHGLNEAWLKYLFEPLGLVDTFIKAGRQVVDSEVFRANEFYQKPCALEAVVLTTKDIPDVSLTIGHAERRSNVWDDQFEKIDLLGVAYRVSGHMVRPGAANIEWAEAAYTGITNLEAVVFDAYAPSVANLAGGRVHYALTDMTALNGYYRHEQGSPQFFHSSFDYKTDMYGLSIQQKAGDFILEPGLLSVRGDGLLFNERTTGINHPLGASLMGPSFYSFVGGSDSFYLKASTEIGKTSLYALYNYTRNNHRDIDFSNGQELDVAIKQPLNDHLSVTFKTDIGYSSPRESFYFPSSKYDHHLFESNLRLFMTYEF